LIKVIVVDDHEVVREGLLSLLDVEEDIQIVGDASNSLETLKLVEKLKPDLVLMDVMMPGVDGIDTAAEIKKRWPTTKVLVLTGLEDEKAVLRAISVGVDGYLLKTAGCSEIVSAIKAIHEGGVYLHPTITRRVCEEIGRPASLNAKQFNITDTDLVVLRLMAKGLKNKSIAYRLHMSEATVKTHISHILAVFNCHDRVQAVVKALKEGLIDIEDDCSDI
jgi:DNA-binding NarL/FixJ family response regulator